jgi:hypothetical protein
MGFRRSGVARACFAAVVFIGLSFVFNGLIIIPARPNFQLDAVLTPAELADATQRNATLAMLKRAAGNDWLFWTGSGILIVAFAAVGLWAIRVETKGEGRESSKRLPSPLIHSLISGLLLVFGARFQFLRK